VEKLSLKQFKERLNAKKIDAVFREGSKGYLGVHYVYKEHAYKGSDLDRSLGWGKIKRHLDLPAEEDFIIKKKLMESLKSGRLIGMTLENDRVKFSSSDPELDKLLNEESQYDGIDLVRKHNRHLAPSLDGISRSRNDFNRVSSILNAFGDDVDEFLRKRKKKQGQQAQKLGS